MIGMLDSAVIKPLPQETCLSSDSHVDRVLDRRRKIQGPVRFAECFGCVELASILAPSHRFGTAVTRMHSTDSRTRRWDTEYQVGLSTNQTAF